MDKPPFFQPESTSDDLPWFDRRNLKDLTQFGPDQDGFMIYVTEEAVIALHEGTLEKLPNEAFGLLMGRAYEDEEGYFTVVSAATYARKLKASKVDVHLSHREMQELRRGANRLYPTADIIGWTHSHPDYGLYSPVDYREQKTWSEHYNIGILTFMTDVTQEEDNPWAVAYRGPSAQLLSLRQDTAPLLRRAGRLPDALLEVSKGRRVLPSDEGPAQSSLSGRINRLWQSRAPFSLLLVILVLVSSGLGAALGSFIFLRLTPTRPAAPSTSFLWNCDQQEGQAPLKVTCTGPVGPDINGWTWHFGDGTTIQNSTAIHVYTKPGSYKITLTVTYSSTSQNVGTLDVKVISPNGSR